jgi:hypothetical protein
MLLLLLTAREGQLCDRWPRRPVLGRIVALAAPPPTCVTAPKPPPMTTTRTPSLLSLYAAVNNVRSELVIIDVQSRGSMGNVTGSSTPARGDPVGEEVIKARTRYTWKSLSNVNARYYCWV